MSGKSDWVAFATADFLVGTTELTNDEVGVYIRLLCHQHQRGSLPADLVQLNRLVPGAKRAWPSLAAKFVACGDGLIRNERMSRESDAASKRIESFQRGAKVVNERRWGGAHRAQHQHAGRSPSESPGESPSDRRASRLAIAERVAERPLPDRIDSRVENNPPTLTGGRGTGGEGESPSEPGQPGQPQLALVRELHPTATEARQRLVRLRGEDKGGADFDGAVESRLRIAAKRFADVGLKGDEATSFAGLTLLAWRWDAWSDELAAIVDEAKTKQAPAGWLVWALRRAGTEATNHVAATA